MNYTDADVAFLVNVKDDAAGLDWMLAHLRAQYPFARVEVVGDGDGGRHRSIAARYRAGYFVTESLFPLACGGRIVERTLGLLLAGSESWLVKLDTDTGIYRRFAAMPAEAGPAIYGTVQRIEALDSGHLVSIQGGCVVFCRAAADTIYSSGLCRDPRLADDPAGTWAASQRLLDSRVARGLTSEDWVIGWTAAQLGVVCRDFAEVRSLWRQPVRNSDGRFAVTHPCKERCL